VVTAARLPDSIDGAQVPKLMRDRYGVTVAGGQGRLKGRIVRIAHCGYYGAFDVVIALTALEAALRDLGMEAEPGAAGGAAQRVFSEAGRAPEPVA
jgi:aspartate aminotransferase-like enzyme